jgi:hypothetical protein
MLLGASATQGSFAADGGSSAGHAAAKVAKPIAPRNLLGRRTFSPSAFERIGPNAIGVSVSRPEGVQGRESGPRGTGAGVQPAAAGGGRSAAGLAKGGGRIDSPTHLQLHTTPTVNPAASNRPLISGTNLIRPGSGPSGIGGPPKGVAGVSGTAVRAKH